MYVRVLWNSLLIYPRNSSQRPKRNLSTPLVLIVQGHFGQEPDVGFKYHGTMLGDEHQEPVTNVRHSRILTVDSGLCL